MPSRPRGAVARGRAGSSASRATAATASRSRAAPAPTPVPSSTGAADAGGAPPDAVAARSGLRFAHQAEAHVVIAASGLPGAGRFAAPAAAAHLAGLAVALAIQQPLRQRGGAGRARERGGLARRGQPVAGAVALAQPARIGI